MFHRPVVLKVCSANPCISVAWEVLEMKILRPTIDSDTLGMDRASYALMSPPQGIPVSTQMRAPGQMTPL